MTVPSALATLCLNLWSFLIMCRQLDIWHTSATKLKGFVQSHIMVMDTVSNASNTRTHARAHRTHSFTQKRRPSPAIVDSSSHPTRCTWAETNGSLDLASRTVKSVLRRTFIFRLLIEAEGSSPIRALKREKRNVQLVQMVRSKELLVDLGSRRAEDGVDGMWQIPGWHSLSRETL